MIIWGSVLLRRTVCGDTDIIRASWLDPDDEFAQVVKTSVNVTTNIPSRDYTHPDNHTITIRYDSFVQTFYKITSGLNFNFHLRPTFTLKALRAVACLAGISGEGGRGASAGEKRGSSPQTPVFLPRSFPFPLPRLRLLRRLCAPQLLFMNFV